MKTLRNWATPLAGGVFLIMSATGLLMFFHLNTQVGKVLHEWLGWLFVVGVALHVVTNWVALKNHLGRNAGRLTIGASVLATVVAVAPFVDKGGKGGNPGEVMRGATPVLTRAPLRDLASLQGRKVEEVIDDLKRAGFDGATPDSSCDALAGQDRGARLKALAAVFPAPAGEREGRGKRAPLRRGSGGAAASGRGENSALAIYFDKSRSNKMSSKLERHAEQLSALGHPVRLRVLRFVVQFGDEGASAGEIQGHVEMPASSLSHHLKRLVEAGLLSTRGEGTFHYYAADYVALRGLTDYLWEDCCKRGKSSKPGCC